MVDGSLILAVVAEDLLVHKDGIHHGIGIGPGGISKAKAETSGGKTILT